MRYAKEKAQNIPLQLLLEADPSQMNIKSYLDDSLCYAAFNKKEIIAACIIKEVKSTVAELFNISVYPKYQKQGIGTTLLKFAIEDLVASSVKRIELGTGAFGYQLTYYQRLGFRVNEVIKDHFLLHYSQPIFEQGIQHKDMLRLYLDLT